MNDALAHLRRVMVEVAGHDAELWLRVPTAGFELPLLATLLAPRSEAVRIDCLSLVLRGFVESLDGAPVTKPRALERAADAATAKALLRVRAELYDGERLEGRVHLACPRCARESVVGLAALETSPWPVVGGDLQPSTPSLSRLFGPGRRPAGVAVAAGARLELPSACRELTRPFSAAVVGAPVTAERDAAAWQRWVPHDAPFETEHAHWSVSNDGFRAVLRMTLALDSLDGARDVSPDTIEAMPMTDFLFADAAYHLLRHVDVRDPERATITCAGCAQPFLSVL
jgi:hypothetical protein